MGKIIEITPELEKDIVYFCDDELNYHINECDYADEYETEIKAQIELLRLLGYDDKANKYENEYDDITRMDTFNTKEKELLEDLRTADSYVPSGWELEIHRWWGDEDDSIPGWYAMKYSEERGEAILLEEYSTEPIITENEAIENNIDVDKCIEEYGCYYSA